jgi:hypothetical protein
VLRRKIRTSRRPTFRRENPFLFYPKRAWEMVSTYVGVGLYFLKLEMIRRQIMRDPAKKEYCDLALTPVTGLTSEENCGCSSTTAPGPVPLTLVAMPAAAEPAEVLSSRRAA